jgi:vacuolar-type H+-ATPase subunit F/Vma7
MITITEWMTRYEVSSKNFPATGGEPLRAGPLQYIRLKVHGHSQGVGWRRLKIAAGNKTAEVFGIFCKLLEIAGNQNRGLRGQILNEKGQEASVEDISFILDIPENQIKNAVEVLSRPEIGWIIVTERKKEPKKEIINTISTQLNSSVQQIPVITGIHGRHAESFDKFWKAYPSRRKTCKQEAYDLWRKLDFSNGLFETIMDALERQKKSDDWTKEGGQYIPNPAKYIRRRRWEDETPVSVTDDPDSWKAKVINESR